MVDRDEVAEPLQSYIAAATLTLAEMANTLVVVRQISRAQLNQMGGDVSAVVELASAHEKMLVLSFPEQTATTLAQRILSEAKVEVNESLIRDCVGEIANVIAGQAKTLLAGTAHQMTFSLPRVAASALPEVEIEQARPGWVVAFDGDAGEFFLGLGPLR